MNQSSGERRLKKSKKKPKQQQQQNELKPQTNPSKIEAICAQNVWNLIFTLDFSIFIEDQLVKEIFHTKSIEHVSLLNQQSDVEFVTYCILRNETKRNE